MFAYLLFVGFKATQKRRILLGRLFIFPAVLALWYFFRLHDLCRDHWTDIFYSMISLAIGSFIGWMMIYKREIHIDRERKIFIFPPTKSILILVLFIFASCYSFSYYYETHPIIPRFAFLADIIIYGMITGKFIGRASNLWYRYENPT